MTDTATTVLEDIQDTYISSQNPDTNYFNETQLLISGTETTLLNIPIAFIHKNSKIHSATLNFNVAGSSGKVDTIARLLSSKDFLIEEATWNNRRSNSPWNVAGGDFDNSKSVLSTVYAYSEVVLADNPIVYYRLNESSGTTVTDRSPNGRNGTYNGSPTLAQPGAIAPDPTSTSVLFHAATTDYITSSYSSFPSVANPFTMEIWIKPNDYSNTSSYGVMGWGERVGANHCEFRLSSGTGTYANSIDIRHNNFVYLEVNTGVSLFDGNWHHIVFTWTGGTTTGTRTLWLDGVKLLSQPISIISSYTGANFWVGRSSAGYFDGLLDEVSVYNYVLDPDKIKLHYAAGKQWAMDITSLVSSVVANGESNLKLGISSIGNDTSAKAFLNSASSTTLSSRPYMNVIFTEPFSTSNDNYSRVIGSWISASEKDLPFTIGPTHLSLGTGTASDTAHHSLTELVTETEKSPISFKGSSSKAAKMYSHFTTKDPTLTGTITELGLYREIGGIDIQTASMRNLAIGTNSYLNTVLADRPASYWRLGESSGTLSVDYQGLYNGTNTSITQGSVGIASETDTACTFAAGSSIAISDSSDYNFPNNSVFSIEAWFYATSTTGKRVIASKETSGTRTGWELYQTTNNTSLSFSRYNSTTTETNTVTIASTASTWTHVVAVYDGGNLLIYVNGTLQTIAASGLAIPSHTTNMLIGSNSAASTNWIGRLDEIAIYNYVLPEARIKSHYMAGIAQPTVSKDFTDKKISDYSLSVTGTTTQIIIDPKVDAGSISRSSGSISFNYRLPSVTGTALGGSNSTTVLQDTGKTWISNPGQWIDAGLYFTAGQGIGEYAIVTSQPNTSSVGFSALAVAPLSGGTSYAMMSRPDYFVVEIGKDSKNFLYWVVSPDTLVTTSNITNTWNTLSLNFSDATQIGTYSTGWFRHFRIIWYSTPSLTIKIDNLQLSEQETERTLISRSEIVQLKSLTTSGYEITDDTRIANIQGDGYSTESTYGIFKDSTNLVNNGSFETNTTGWSAIDSNSSMSSSIVSTNSKFGKNSLLLVNSNSGDDDYYEFTTSASANTKYIVTAWLDGSKIEAGALGNRCLAVWDNNDVSTFVFTSQSTPTVGWVRHRQIITTSAGGSALKIRLYSPKGSIYWDGIQVEQRERPTPFIYTDGATSTRSKARVQFPIADAFTSSQGWIALSFKTDWHYREPDISGQAAYNSHFFLWLDGSKYFKLYYSLSGLSWTWEINNGTNTYTNTIKAYPFEIGQRQVLICKWAFPTNMGISQNGSAFTNVSSATAPSMATTTADIGSTTAAGATDQSADSGFYWVAAGSGTLTDSDADSIYDLYDPKFTDFASTAIANFIWTCDSEYYMVPFSRNYSKSYKFKYDLNIGDTRTEY